MACVGLDLNCAYRVGVVVPLVETQVPGPPGAARRAHHHVVEDRADQPFVMHVRPGDAGGQWHPTPIREDVPFHAGFRAIRRIGAGLSPPFGAFTVALSSEVHVH